MTRSALVCALALCVGNPIPANEKAKVPTFETAEFETHVNYLASDELAGRLPGSDGSEKAASYIIRAFEAAKLRPLQASGNWFQEFPLPAKVTGRNILAVFPGRGPLQKQAVLVTGHYDHLGLASPDRQKGNDRIFNGADDNAAGVSIMLMIIQQFAEMKNTFGDNHRTVIFSSFDAEEKGLLGAKYYVRNPIWPLDQTDVVINFDGGGRLRMGKVFASDAETNPLLSAVVKKAATAQGIVAETRFGGHGRSDHAVFADIGIPGVHFVTGAHNDYHQVTDEADRLNFEGGAKIAAIGYETLLEMMTTPGRIQFHKLKPEFNVNFGINLARIVGIIPMVNAQEGRYPQILYVVPNSPAAKLGIQSGDQVTALDGMKFQRVEDFISIFPRLNLSDGVRISILRAGEDTEVFIPDKVIAKFSGPASTPLPDGRYKVHFHYTPTSKDVTTVYLAGEFNNWNPVGIAMAGPNPDGEFTTEVTLSKGFHEYKFVEEGTEWKSDPLNMHTTGFYKNSVVWVGASKKSSRHAN